MKVWFWLFLISAALVLVSCKSTEIVEVPVETVKKEYIHNTRVDSIYIRDSIDRWQKGDTLYIDRWHTVYKYTNKIDTVVVTDSIPKIFTVEKEVEVNHIYWWQKGLMAFGASVLVVGIILLAIKVKKVI